MKLVVYLPALDEAATIAEVIRGIPRDVPGIRQVEVIVVDDGSTDATAAIARQLGATVVSHPSNFGSGKTFTTGVLAALAAGADIIASIDSDGQFNPEDIPRLIEPIQAGVADVVLCTRFAGERLIGRMRWHKRLGNWLLSRGLGVIAGRRFTDVCCGFRAFTRDAAACVRIRSDFEYVHESLLVWVHAGMRVREVALPVLAERRAGRSRMVRSVLVYAIRSVPALMRAAWRHRRHKSTQTGKGEPSSQRAGQEPLGGPAHGIRGAGATLEEP